MMGFVIFASLGVLRIAWGMEVASAWDLQAELLCLPAPGGSVRQMQRLSHFFLNACTDVPRHVEELARIGSNHNRERNLHRWANRQAWRALLPDIYEFTLPLTTDGIHEHEGHHACLLPHETFASLFGFPELFRELLLGGEGALRSFWEGSRAAGDRWYTHHPVEAVHSNPEHCVPFGIFGDDAGLYLNQKVLVLLWGSVAVQSLTLDQRILFCAITYKNLVPGKSIQMLYKIMRWSFAQLALGTWPSCDHEGRPFSASHHPRRYAMADQPLAGEYIGVFSELRGDWKWQVEALALQNWYATLFACHLCRAHRRIRRHWWTQFRRTAHIRRTRTTHAAFRDQASSIPPDLASPLIHIVGFCIWRAWVDAMHCLDHGIYQIVAACCLYELVRQGIWAGRNLEERYYAAHAEYRAWCTENKHPAAPRFEYKKLVPERECPVFTQQTAKAAMMKHIMAWLYSVLSRTGVSAGPHNEMRFSLFHHWQCFEQVCARNGRFLPPAEIELVAAHVEKALLAQHALKAEANSQDNLTWHLLPNNHMMTHLAFDFVVRSAVNPRRITNYSDEDFVGRIKRIARACHGASAGLRIMHRYIILVATRWYARLAVIRGVR